MKRKKANKLFKKYIKNKCSDEEKKLLDDFVNSYQGKDLKWSDWKYGDKIKFQTRNLDRIKNKIDKNKNSDKNFKLFRSPAFKYAAMLGGIIVMVASLYYNMNTSVEVEQEEKNEITLQLENGDIKIITENGKTKVTDSKGSIVGTQNGNQLVYDQEIEKDVLEYNTLTVPYGKRFEILLSDGTEVHLNAGTSLKYPIKFIEGENRQVFLQGEAYFSVTKDANHPFIVNANKIDIRVLGTEFNVSSYPEDKHIHTVLTEGAVSIYNQGDSYNPETAVILKPGFIASWEKTNNQVTIEEADIEMHTAWMKGRLILKEVAFKDILKKLERQYDVVITNHNTSLDNRYFTARFDIEDIHLVMKNLSQYASFSYEFNENQIFINP